MLVCIWDKFSMVAVEIKVVDVETDVIKAVMARDDDFFRKQITILFEISNFCVFATLYSSNCADYPTYI